ncbi:MAG: hypothetical protein HYT80_04330 [Euryarchaeota archaeon]|nr:hypothetical protein [Euryarchaeota archaeon]
MFHTQGPFYTAGPIPPTMAGTYLYGFEEERRLLVQGFSGRRPARLALTGAPESGLTSLVLGIGPSLPSPRAHLDCSRVWPASRAGFFRLLATALGVDAPTAPDRPPGAVYADLALPAKGQRGLLVLDNAHALASLDPSLLADIYVLLDRLPYHVLLTGDATTLAPFADAQVALRPFSEATAADFLRRRFQAAGLAVGEEALDIFYEFSRGGPADLQRLGEAAWLGALATGARHLGATEAEAALAEVVEHLPNGPMGAWASLRGLMRDIFVAMCLYDESSPTVIAQRLGLEPKNVVVLLGRLVEAHRVVERTDRGVYRVRDPLLKHYVRKSWSSPILRS